MKKHSRKLNLNRETLIPLQADELSQINGGQGITLPTTNTTSTFVSTTLPTLTLTVSK